MPIRHSGSWPTSRAYGPRTVWRSIRARSLSARRRSSRSKKGAVDVISGNHHNLYARNAKGEDFLHLAQAANIWTDNFMVVSDGIKSVKDLRGKKIVEVKFVPAQTNLATIELAITEAGYDANDKKRDADAYAKLDECCKIDK